MPQAADVMRHALVTGGAGFIGSHLIDRLLAEGWQVTAWDNFEPFYPRAVKEANLSRHMGNPHFYLVPADIREPSTFTPSRIEAAIPSTVDTIVHLAAKVGVLPSLQDPLGYQAANVDGTHHMLHLAKDLGVEQFVLASSSSVYGINPNVPWLEDEVVMPISPYAVTKASAELLAHAFRHMYGIRVVALRFFTVHGPRQRPDLAIHKFARLMLEGKPLPFYGDGSSSRDYTYIDDVISGVRAAMDYTGSEFEIINIGNTQPISLAEMVHCLEDVLGTKATLEQLPAQGCDVQRTAADISKARSLLGYHPKTDFETGVRSFVEWLDRSSMELRTAVDPPASNA
jgi:UDP-glucuronate 4-epimerase